MKTTVEISDALFNAVKQLAKQNQTTMRELVEDGLRRVLKDANVQGRAMLVSDPQRRQQMEEEHVISRVIKNLN